MEVLISFAVFAVVMTSASVGMVNALQASHLSQQRVDAANVAQEYIAQTIAAASKVAPQSGLTTTPHVGNGNTGAGGAANEYFTVLQWITFDSGNTCHPGALFTVNVEVHQEQTNQFLARSDARVACPPA
jgi:Tfp pilus assembly protein PilV